MEKKSKHLNIQVYLNSTEKPVHYGIPIKSIVWFVVSIIIVVSGVVFWLPDMVKPKNAEHIVELSQEQKSIQITVNNLEKRISEAKYRFESGSNLRSKVNQIAGIKNFDYAPEVPRKMDKKYNMSMESDVAKIQLTLNSFKKLHEALLENEGIVNNIPILHPVRHSKTITNVFGIIDDMLTGSELPHRGVDFAVRDGDTIIATGNGTVSNIVNRKSGFGLSMEVEHSQDIKTFYAHLQKTLVNKGAVVQKGQPIAIAGRSGSIMRPSLHYEIQIKGVPVNPSDYFITQ